MQQETCCAAAPDDRTGPCSSPCARPFRSPRRAKYRVPSRGEGGGGSSSSSNASTSPRVQSLPCSSRTTTLRRSHGLLMHHRCKARARHRVEPAVRLIRGAARRRDRKGGLRAGARAARRLPRDREPVRANCVRSAHLHREEVDALVHLHHVLMHECAHVAHLRDERVDLPLHVHQVVLCGVRHRTRQLCLLRELLRRSKPTAAHRPAARRARRRPVRARRAFSLPGALDSAQQIDVPPTEVVVEELHLVGRRAHVCPLSKAVRVQLPDEGAERRVLKELRKHGL
mmetsp:Transcript_15301/g.47709  ORF Transcript_15301/g.47709 Transcript_15301/m.47709 type:complete len:285 (+) Transcript_15301:762-1616(+)